MFTVVKIGGCNGSGKTSIVRGVLSHIGCTPGIGSKVSGYKFPYDTATVAVLGDYSPERACGGMDTITDKDQRLGLVKSNARDGQIVFYEGLITGKTYGAMGALSDRQKGHWIYAFMDTPFEVCVERVLQRRKAKGNDAPFDPERTMRPTFKSCASVAARAAAEGHRVVMIDHRLKPATAAKKLLTLALEHYHAGR